MTYYYKLYKVEKIIEIIVYN